MGITTQGDKMIVGDILRPADPGFEDCGLAKVVSVETHTITLQWLNDGSIEVLDLTEVTCWMVKVENV